MAKERKTIKTSAQKPIEQYEHKDKHRLNNPPVGLVDAHTDNGGLKKKTYQYDPHLDPQLVWAGKAEHTSFEVPTVSLHVHERIDPRRIIETVRKGEEPSQQMSLFEAERKPLREAIEFYKHKENWTNRLIAGDSLLVMNSLLEKEGMGGKVQMIYFDPPYGIKYGSNFQPFVNKRDVKDGKDEDLTAEPEMIKAFRDTWELGIHSYLTYLRDRLLLARELLHESGSIFVQISDENVHHVRELMDEVFGAGNFCNVVSFVKTGGKGGELLDTVNDFLVWYARDKDKIKFRQLYFPKVFGGEKTASYVWIESPDGKERRRLTAVEQEEQQPPKGWRLFSAQNLTSQSGGDTSRFPVKFEGRVFVPTKNFWKTNTEGMENLIKANRLIVAGNSLNYVRYQDDFPAIPINNIWTDTAIAGFSGEEKVFVVQTAKKVIQRCLLMTTDPGDLVLDPTCGSGTTAYVAEQWGRRWITCDTSRVAITLAKQRLMTAVFDYYELAHPNEGVGSGFKYKTVPHITLKSIANNPEIDEIYKKMHPAIEAALAKLNAALKGSPIRFEVTTGGRAGQIVDFAAPDSQTFTMPSGQVVQVNQLLEWEVPFECPDTWPETARKALEAFHKARRNMQEKMDEAIAKYAPQETLYDQPFVDAKKIRVTGPFTVEAVPAPVAKSFEEVAADTQMEADRSIARSGETLRQEEWRNELLRTGVRAKGGKRIEFTRVEPLSGTRFLQAEAETKEDNPKRVVICFGPEHAPLEQRMVELALEEARMLKPKPEIILFCAFHFDPEARKDIEETNWPGMTLLEAQMNADLLTDDLKKKRSSNESFWLIGQPDVQVVNSGEWLVVSKELLVDSGQSANQSSKPVLIANYACFKKFSGLNCLAEIKSLSREDLCFYLALSEGRDLWDDLANEAGCRFSSGEHRRGAEQKHIGGIQTIFGYCQRLDGGIGDLDRIVEGFEALEPGRFRKFVEGLRGNPKVIERAHQISKKLTTHNLPLTTHNLPLTTHLYLQIEVHGFDYYNPKTGTVESGGKNDIAMWMLDHDYDGRSLFPSQVFFPMAGAKEGWATLAKNLKAEIDEEKIEAFGGTVSLPFTPGKNVAVKIIDARGIESLKIIRL
jgi:adenine-specific DNA-methyltransferase